MSKNFLSEAINLMGGQTATAKNLGCSQALVWKWLHVTDHGITSEYALPMCKEINWVITPHQLRPDLYPHPDDGLPPEYRCNHDHHLGRRSNDRRHRNVIINNTPEKPDSC